MAITELRLPKENILTSLRWVLTPREPWWHFWLSLSLTACTCHSCQLGLTVLVQSQLERTLLLGMSSTGITLCSCSVKGLLADLALPGKISTQHRSGLKPCCYHYCAIISCGESKIFPNVECSSTVCWFRLPWAKKTKSTRQKRSCYGYPLPQENTPSGILRAGQLQETILIFQSAMICQQPAMIHWANHIYPRGWHAASGL